MGAADVLNGTRPVTAIQSSYGQVPSAAAAALDLQSDSEQWQLAAEGPLVVRDAVVYTGPDGVVVASGTIATQALFTDVRGGASHALPGMTALSASITTDAGSVRIEDSCTAPNRAYAQRIWWSSRRRSISIAPASPATSGRCCATWLPGVPSRRSGMATSTRTRRIAGQQAEWDAV